MAIRSFFDEATEEINYGRRSKKVLRRLPPKLHERARIKLARLAAASTLEDLRELRGSRLEALQGERKGQFSVRINDQYRICFSWKEKHAYNVEIVDYHR